MKEKHFISNKNESVRMFKAGYMEAVSKTHWTVPLWVFIPIISYFLYLTFISISSIVPPIILFIAGIFVWTFVEYAMHRFVFHFEPKSKIGQRLHWIMHGVHHDYPQDAKRLVLPPSLSLPLATIFFLLFYLLLPIPELYPYFAGFLLGYLIYDIGHYALHHFSFKGNLFKKLKLHHMRHHYIEPEVGYGVSSPLWDYIFHTGTREKRKKVQQKTEN